MASSKNQRAAVLVLTVLPLSLCAATSAPEFAGGTGEPNDPYQIATPEQLLAIGSDPNLLDKAFILMADLDLDPNLPGGQVFDSAVIAPTPKYPYRYTDITFTGRFNGNGHVIRNLTVNASVTNWRIGLFGIVGRHGRVEDLGLEAVSVQSPSNVGAFAGENWGTITGCHVTGVVRGKSGVGGIVGTNGSYRAVRAAVDLPSESGMLPSEPVEGTISFCGADVEVIGAISGDQWQTGSSDIGALVGTNSGGVIYACRACGSASGDYLVGGLVGENRKGLIRSSYADTWVQANQYGGGLAGGNNGDILFCYAAGPVSAGEHQSGLAAMGSGSTYLCYWDTQTTGCTASTGGRARTPNQMKERQTFRGWGYENQWVLADGQDYPRLAWESLAGEPLVDGLIVFEAGSGTVENPYEIRTVEELLALGYSWPFFSKHFVLTADLDASGIDPNAPVAIGTLVIPFSGSFDGGGRVISGWRCWSLHEDAVGLFGCVDTKGAVENITIAGSDVRGRRYVAILAGHNEGTFMNCFAEGHVYGDSLAAGIAGGNGSDGRVVSCGSAGEVAARIHAGGLIGTNVGWITACHSSAAVRTVGGFAGGLVGVNNGLVSCSYARGAVCAAAGAAGFVAWNGTMHGLTATYTGEISDCYSTGMVRTDADAAGFAGINGAVIRRCYSAGAVSPADQADGFAGPPGNMGHEGIVTEACYWDIEASGVPTSAVGTGETTEQMRQQVSFEGWDFEGVWMICEGKDYPRLRWEQVECEE